MALPSSFRSEPDDYRPVRHLKARLVDEPSIEIRTATARALRRHCNSEDGLHSWWWDQDKSTLAWLRTATELGLLVSLNDSQSETLATVLHHAESDSLWRIELLAVGGYDGRRGDILALCKNELNDGAVDAITSIRKATPVLHLAECAALAQRRRDSTGAGQPTRRFRTRPSGSTGDPTLTAVTELANFRQQPLSDATTNDWFNRLRRIEEVWGYGWILRQAVATVPFGIDLDALADRAAATQPSLAAAAAVAQNNARSHKADAEWWRQSLSSCKSDIDRRHWVSP